MTRRAHLLCAALLGLAVLVDYGGHVWHAEFVYQDAHWHHDDLTPPPLLALTHVRRTVMPWSWWVQQRFTPSPAAFHIVNLVLHLTCGALVWVLARRLGASAAAAWIACALFVLDVGAVATAAYAAERTEAFAALGVLAGAVVLAGAWHRWTPVAVLAAFVFGIAGKESAVAFIAIAGVLVSWRVFGALEGWPVATAFALLAAVTWLAGHVIGGLLPADPGGWMLAQITAVGRVAIVAVAGLGASVEFDWSAVPLVARVSIAILAVGLVEAVWRLRHRAPLLVVGMLWSAACVVPRLIIWTPDVVTESHGYLALVGVALAAAACVDLGDQEGRLCM